MLTSTLKAIACFCAVSLLVCSCATVDLEKELRDTGPGKIEDLPVTVRVDPEIQIIEKPVYIPEEKPSARNTTPQGRQTVQASNTAGIMKPSEYSHAAMIYNYDPDWVYEVYAQPLRASDIILEPGELVLEPPFISDSVRWVLGAGVSYNQGVPVQHIYVKPSDPSIQATLIINTDRRVYHIILRSFTDVFMPMVRWRYYSNAMPATYAQAPQYKDTEPDAINPKLLVFNYRITYKLKKPAWLPELVFNDNSKTYIIFPESVLVRELPAVFENRKDVINYRVIDNMIVIDKLVDSLTVKIERKEVTITKKKH